MIKIVLTFDTLYISFFPQIFSQVKGTYSFPSSLPLKKKFTQTEKSLIDLCKTNGKRKGKKKKKFISLRILCFFQLISNRKRSLKLLGQLFELRLVS